MHSVTSNAVAEAGSYSTTEKFTGKYWIDGKPIYTITKDLGAYTGGWIYPYHNIANMDTIILFYAMGYKNDSNNTCKLFPNYDNYISMTNTQFAISENNASYAKIIATVFYTKTTD